mmetsp:Transcript_47057/g.106098  ORF Transcript_47057/g.106098 Transcript_47057/m.106098 type:complete len:257 (+) Transcript_47057:2747-3517(+)
MASNSSFPCGAPSRLAGPTARASSSIANTCCCLADTTGDTTASFDATTSFDATASFDGATYPIRTGTSTPSTLKCASNQSNIRIAAPSSSTPPCSINHNALLMHRDRRMLPSHFSRMANAPNSRTAARAALARTPRPSSAPESTRVSLAKHWRNSCVSNAAADSKASLARFLPLATSRLRSAHAAFMSVSARCSSGCCNSAFRTADDAAAVAAKAAVFAALCAASSRLAWAARLASAWIFSSLLPMACNCSDWASR